MDKQADIGRVWEIIAKAGICMMTTHFSDGLRARPMEARPDKDEGVIFFLTDIRGLKDDEVESDPNVCLAFIYTKEKVYLSVTGEALVSRDTARARDLWNAHQQVWWPGGPEDPNVRVLRFEPHRAEMWDGPASSAVATFEFVKARVTGKTPDLGEKRKFTVDLD